MESPYIERDILKIIKPHLEIDDYIFKTRGEFSKRFCSMVNAIEEFHYYFHNYFNSKDLSYVLTIIFFCLVAWCPFIMLVHMDTMR